MLPERAADDPWVGRIGPHPEVGDVEQVLHPVHRRARQPQFPAVVDRFELEQLGRQTELLPQPNARERMRSVTEAEHHLGPFDRAHDIRHPTTVLPEILTVDVSDDVLS